MKTSAFDNASRELEDHIAEGEQKPAQQESASDRIVKALGQVMDLVKGQTSDLSAEKDRRGALTGAADDPAKSPKKSGGDYPDSSKYEARKGHGKDDDDDDDDDKDGKLNFFKKKKSKKVKKAEEEEEEEEELNSDPEADVVDATHFMKSVRAEIKDLRKTVQEISEGVAVFGELLTGVADPKKDKLLLTMSQAIGHVIKRQDAFEKSLEPIAKALKVPGNPRAAGKQDDLLHKAKPAAEAGNGETTTDEGGEANPLTQTEKDRLFKACNLRQISSQEMQKAINTNDRSIFERIKA